MNITNEDKSKIMAIFMKAKEDENGNISIPSEITLENKSISASECFATLMNYVYNNLHPNTLSRCEDCYFKKTCIDGANYKVAEKCTKYKPEESISCTNTVCDANRRGMYDLCAKLQSENARLKEMLKSAVEDIENISDALDWAIDNGCLYVKCEGCPLDNENNCKWQHADETMKLIGGMDDD